MAFFKSRKGADEQAATVQPESVEAMRRRAKHRLIGAAVLVIIALVAFPLLFDTQPRPVAVDIPIEIPDKAKAKPLVLPAKPAASVAAAPAASATAAATVPAAASLGAKEEVIASTKPPEPKPAASRPEAKPEPKAEPKPEPAKPAAKPDDGAKAQALLEGRPPEAVAAAAPGEGRFVVQVGAFADAAKARETRQKLEKAGLKTYAQVVKTKEGDRTRVRIGPFATRADAEKAAGRIKGLELPASILTL